MNCTYTKPDGTACGSQALTNDKFCFFHSEENKDQAKLARLKGGLNRRVNTVSDFPGAIKTAENLLNTINIALSDAWELEGGERRLRAVTALLRVAVDILPIVDMESRLQILEAAIHGANSSYQ